MNTVQCPSFIGIKAIIIEDSTGLVCWSIFPGRISHGPNEKELWTLFVRLLEVL